MKTIEVEDERKEMIIIDNTKLEKQIGSECSTNFEGYFVFSKKPELQKYFMNPVDVLSSFLVHEEDSTKIVGVNNTDINNHIGKVFFDAVVSYHNQDMEDLSTIEMFILEDDIIYLEEKEALRKMLFEKDFDKVILENRKCIK